MILDEWQLDFTSIPDNDIAAIQFNKPRLSSSLIEIKDFLLTDGGRLFMEAARQSLVEAAQFQDVMVIDRATALEDASMKAQYKLLRLMMSDSLGLEAIIAAKVKSL